MIFNVKKRPISKFLVVGVLSIIGTLTHADLVEANAQTMDWSDGVQDVEEYGESVPYQTYVIPADEYAEFNIRPLYKDSVIKYNSEDDVLMEVKEFLNNVVMYYFPKTNTASIVDRDNEDPIKNGWNVRCSKDRITDQRDCFITKFAVGVWKSSKYGLTLTVSSDVKKLSFNKYSYIRIDEKPAYKVKGYFDGQAALNVVNQMKNGQTAYTRFSEWDGEQYDETLSLWGFSAAYDVMNRVYSRL